MNPIVIDSIISYIPATNEPLSADVGIIKGDKCTWIFDVGNDTSVANQINDIPGNKNIVISHFHADHMGNIDKIDYENIYGGSYTIKKVTSGIPVTEIITINDGVDITLFPLPSTHAKGCIGLEVNGEFAFVGDGTYATRKDGQIVYNASLLNETIIALENIKADKLLISHDSKYVRSKEDVLKELKDIYSKRVTNEAYIV